MIVQDIYSGNGNMACLLLPVSVQYGFNGETGHDCLILKVIVESCGKITSYYFRAEF
jgi:hypothetical protein